MRLMQIVEGFQKNVLYHYTSGPGALAILQENRFRLNAYFGDSYRDDDLDPNRFYYLSTTRTVTGVYHRENPYGVLLVLDRDKIHQHYAIRPIEYYRLRRCDRAEAEDRIVTNKPYIENARDYILEAHIGRAEEKPIYHGRWDYLLAKAYFEAKKHGIPAYYYSNMNDWKLLRKDRAEVPDAKKMYSHERDVRLRFAKNRGPQFPRSRSALATWVEVYHKDAPEHLSDEGQHLVYRLRYVWSTNEAYRRLANDIHNEKRKPTASLRNLILVFRELGIRKPQQYIDYLKNKWH